MSDEILIDRRFALVVKRCWGCNRFFAAERGVINDSARCTSCLRSACDEEERRSDKLERRIRSLRGVITRLGGKRGRK